MSKDIFNGVEKSEVAEFAKRLAMEKKQDCRYAAIQIKGDSLAEKDITFHKTAFEACKYILMAPTDRGLYIFRSVSLLEDDVKRILEGKSMTKEAEITKSKGLDLER